MAHHRLSGDQVIWSFGPDFQPVLEVDPGDVVTFETNDCFSGQIKTASDLVTDIDMNRLNSATGPVAVRGAEPGDSLVTEIIDVRARFESPANDDISSGGSADRPCLPQLKRRSAGRLVLVVPNQHSHLSPPLGDATSGLGGTVRSILPAIGRTAMSTESSERPLLDALAAMTAELGSTRHTGIGLKLLSQRRATH